MARVFYHREAETPSLGSPPSDGTMKWYTCTPVAFGGGPDFFARDSGLLSLGFQSIGIESRAVMPGTPARDDEPELLRTAYCNLEDPLWWGSHGLDGVVLYSWGHPKFGSVADAIRKANVKLVLNQDSSGLVSPLAGICPWMHELLIVSGAGQSLKRRLHALFKIGDGLTRGLVWVDPMRARHLRAGDMIAAVSPLATDRYRKLCRHYGGEKLSRRVRFIPHPVSTIFQYNAAAKERRVVSVGRWDDNIQKRPALLIEVIDQILSRDSNVAFDIVGNMGDAIPAWHASLPLARKERVMVHGRLQPAALASLMSRAMVSYCPSAYESFHIASAEALCSGATVVAGPSPALPAFGWFTGEGHGRMASIDLTDSHCDAILSEIAAWDSGERNAQAIACLWGNRLHAPTVARMILSKFDIIPNSV